MNIWRDIGVELSVGFFLLVMSAAVLMTYLLSQ
jgi:hypothetical protein